VDIVIEFGAHEQTETKLFIISIVMYNENNSFDVI